MPDAASTFVFLSDGALCNRFCRVLQGGTMTVGRTVIEEPHVTPTRLTCVSKGLRVLP